MAVTAATWADEWVKPVYTGSYLSLEAATGNIVYIYNTEGQQFLTEGNDWGTHASVGDRGLQFKVTPYAADGQEWDGKTYIIQDSTMVKSAWMSIFITEGGHIYMDRSTQEDYFFSFKDLGSNTYQIMGADLNPVWNTTSGTEGFVVGHYTNYYDERDLQSTGTGVIYDAPDSYGNTLLTTWAFVSSEDYEAYTTKLDVYETAQELKAALDKATQIGVPDIDDEKGVYANTASTAEQLQAAIASLNKKTLAYYEVFVTPSNPMEISNDPCNGIDAWTNGINASTWNTQTWIDESWEGFEGTTLNIWSGSLEGKAYKKLTDLPNGIYVVSMAVYAQDMNGYAYANKNQKTVAGGTAGKTYVVTTEVTDGTLEFGYGQETSGTNWVAIDNAVVNYYGIGVEAYRFWLNGLLESAPKFDDVIVQDALIDRYDAVLASVNTVETKEEILNIIPTYEAILDEIALNIDAYAALNEEIGNTVALANETGINDYYGDLLGETNNAMRQVINQHKLGTEDVQAHTATLKQLATEAQQYLWNVEKLASEMETAALIYEEYKDACSDAAREAYETFAANYPTLDMSEYTDADVNKVIEELYSIEFNLTVPATPASDENPVDYTAKIQYPSFDGGATGWTNDGWTTCGSNTWVSFADGEVIDQLYLNLWNEGAARVYQTLTNLPAGTYELQISAFSDAEGLQVYANDNFQNVLVGQNESGLANIYGEEVVPFEHTEGTAVYYGNIYIITTTVGEDGIMEIGARSNNSGAVWGMIDNVKLNYFGSESTKTPTAIDDVAETAQGNTVVAIFSMAGTKVAALQKGINIVKYANGQVQKILVK